MQKHNLYSFAQGTMFTVVRRLGISEDDASPIYNEISIKLQSEPPPPVPDGYKMMENIPLDIPAWCAEDVIPFACFNKERILICSHLKAPQLIKPWTLKTHWLWLHMLCLGAIESNRLANACYTQRIQPCIVGMKPQMPENFPLAYATVDSIYAHIADLENLPF